MTGTVRSDGAVVRKVRLDSFLDHVLPEDRDLVKGFRDFSRKELESVGELDHTTLKKVVVELVLEQGLPSVFGDASAISNAS